MITAIRDGKHLVITRSGIEWSDNEEDATVFATQAAFAQCLGFGRLRGLTFVRWVR